MNESQIMARATKKNIKTTTHNIKRKNDEKKGKFHFITLFIYYYIFPFFRQLMHTHTHLQTHTHTHKTSNNKQLCSRKYVYTHLCIYLKIFQISTVRDDKQSFRRWRNEQERQGIFL